MDENEIISNSADVFKVHTCEECGGFVIEKFLTRDNTEIGSVNKEPHATIDVPRECAYWLLGEIRKWVDQLEEN